MLIHLDVGVLALLHTSKLEGERARGQGWYEIKTQEGTIKKKRRTFFFIFNYHILEVYGTLLQSPNLSKLQNSAILLVPLTLLSFLFLFLFYFC
jgi:hypothetical protein